MISESSSEAGERKVSKVPEGLTVRKRQVAASLSSLSVAKIVFRSSYLLSPGQVHVYYALIDRSLEEIESFERLLSQEELARAGRFKNSIDRQRYIVRQGILRELLGGYLGCEPALVEIHRDANGKPFPAPQMNPENLQFSDSHSENMAAFAFGYR